MFVVVSCFCVFGFGWFGTLVFLVKVVALQEKSSMFLIFSQAFRTSRTFLKFSETEFVGVFGGALFGTNLEAVLVIDYSRTVHLHFQGSRHCSMTIAFGIIITVSITTNQT